MSIESFHNSPKKKSHESLSRLRFLWYDIVELLEKHNGCYGETLRITSKGYFDTQKRMDGLPPYLTAQADLETPEELYQFAHRMTEAYPDLEFSFEVDPQGRWLRYKVFEKNKT